MRHRQEGYCRHALYPQSCREDAENEENFADHGTLVLGAEHRAGDEGVCRTARAHGALTVPPLPGGLRWAP